MKRSQTSKAKFVQYLAGLAMALSSVSVVANSLRLGRFRPAGGEGRS